MKKKNNINEVTIKVTNPNDIPVVAAAAKNDPKTIIDYNSKNPTTAVGAVGAVKEEENVDAVIEPQDKATIKYLSNVIDSKTNKVSPPFTIDSKKYQMVNGLTPERKIVLAVFCHDDMDDEGNNLIHPVEHFEKTIAMPMMEKMKMGKKKEEHKDSEPLNLGHYKFFIVNEKTGKFRKLKTLEELAKDTLGEDEKFMGLKQFKKYFENMVFGSAKKSVKKENILEAVPQPAATAQPAGAAPAEENDLHAKAKRLTTLISKKIPASVFKTIRTNKVAEKEVIEAFAELVGVPKQGLQNLLKTIKSTAVSNPKQQAAPTTGAAPSSGSQQMPPENQLAPAGMAESKVITKAMLEETLKKPKTIKTIKVKDLR